MSRLILLPFNKDEPADEITYSVGNNLFKTKSGKVVLINPLSKGVLL